MSVQGSNHLWKPVRRLGGAGFTLVELLVVIAVICLLVARFLPVLIRAKAQSQSTVCKNHLSQIGRAMTMYLSDNNRYPSALGSDSSTFQTWADHLTPYSPLDWTNISWHCPTYIANKGVVQFTKPPPAGGRFDVATSYSYNAFGIAGWGFQGTNGSIVSKPKLGLGYLPRSTPREQEILAPSEMYVVADARARRFQNTAEFVGREWMNPYRLFPGGFVFTEADPPHSQGYNILFGDTHVASVKRKDYLYPPRTSHDWNRDNQSHPELWAPTNDWVIQN